MHKLPWTHLTIDSKVRQSSCTLPNLGTHGRSTKLHFRAAIATLLRAACSKTTIARNNQIQHLRMWQEPTENTWILVHATCFNTKSLRQQKCVDAWTKAHPSTDASTSGRLLMRMPMSWNRTNVHSQHLQMCTGLCSLLEPKADVQARILRHFDAGHLRSGGVVVCHKGQHASNTVALYYTIPSYFPDLQNYATHFCNPSYNSKLCLNPVPWRDVPGPAA